MRTRLRQQEVSELSPHVSASKPQATGPQAQIRRDPSRLNSATPEGLTVEEMHSLLTGAFSGEEDLAVEPAWSRAIGIGSFALIWSAAIWGVLILSHRL